MCWVWLSTACFCLKHLALLLAYMKGNVGLCKALVRAKACLAATNKNGVSIFNYQLATKQLLVRYSWLWFLFFWTLSINLCRCRLLEQLSDEPPWAEYDYCMECGNKFGITTRKHHWSVIIAVNTSKILFNHFVCWIWTSSRHCGRILCGKCSDQVVPILKFQLSKPVRVCILCAQVLGSGLPSPWFNRADEVWKFPPTPPMIFFPLKKSLS